MDSKVFVAGLVDEMQQIFSQLGESGALELSGGGREDVAHLLRLALASELEASEVAAHWLPTTREIDAKTVFAEQCSDEMRHYNLIVERLRELGDDLEGFDPTANFSPLYHYLRGLRTTLERIAAGPFTCEAVAEVRNEQFIAFCHSVGDHETARLYEKIIQPEEVHHHRLGREILEKYATTPELQALVANAMRSSLAITDELQSLSEMSGGLPSIPVS